MRSVGTYRRSGYGFRPSRQSLGRPLLQRQCACGSRAESGGGACSGCAEKEGLLQLHSSNTQTSQVPTVVYDVLSTPGQPLPAESQDFMGARFGYDFSGVRVHSDMTAQRSAKATNAEAYTVGRDIVFALGRYNPDTTPGQKLLAHELAHVVQQDSATDTSGSITMGKADQHEAEADDSAAEVVHGSSMREAPNPATAGLQLQAKENDANASSTANSAASPSPQAPCIEEVHGEDIPSLLQAGVLTIIEFGATWCGPCKQNQAGLQAVCDSFKKTPPPVTVRIYSIDIDAPGNEAVSKAYGAPPVPKLYFYVGNTLKGRYEYGIEPDVMQYMVAEQVEYASTSGWWRGAKKGAKWGALGGLAAGIGGAVAVGKGALGNLEGNNLMLGILGAVGAGVVAGGLIGGAIGAIAGAVGDDRNQGPKQQKRKKLQPKLRNHLATDPEEREADEWANVISNSEDVVAHSTNPNGQPLDTPTRAFMEGRFNHDFAHVRIHRDEEANTLTEHMNAYAVTKGSDISFAGDAYNPSTSAGKAIMAHELAHVIQNDNDSKVVAQSELEAEADAASTAVLTGEQGVVQNGSSQPALAMTRGEKTAAGAALGGAIGGAAGGLLGLGIASQMKGTPFLSALAVGGLVGMGVGALVGGLIGFFSRRHESESVAEAEELIRRRYGKYIPNAKMGPLHNASVHVVTKEELCERKQCRSPEADCNLIGWTDTGVPIKPSKGPADQPAPIAKPEDEPTCNNKQMEHATVDHPVIYYVKNDQTAGTLIHEGLHAHSHPSFEFLHNHVVEGTTEYFARRLQDDINIPHYGSYNDEVKSVEKLVDLVGEERLAQGYFTGMMPELHQAVNSKLGPCALITWAFNLQMGSEARAQQIMESRNQNYCQSDELQSAPPKDLTPAAPVKSQAQQTVEQK
jgi:hypothetical protein